MKRENKRNFPCHFCTRGRFMVLFVERFICLRGAKVTNDKWTKGGDEGGDAK